MLLKNTRRSREANVEKIDSLDLRIFLSFTLLRAVSSKSNQEMLFRPWSEWSGLWTNSSPMVEPPLSPIEFQVPLEFMLLTSKLLASMKGRLLSTMM
jgi:hypothetical protein